MPKVSRAGFSIWHGVEKHPIGPIGFEKEDGCSGIGSGSAQTSAKVGGGWGWGEKGSHLVEIVLVELADE
jgi:hypothetical protein